MSIMVLMSTKTAGITLSLYLSGFSTTQEEEILIAWAIAVMKEVETHLADH